MDYNLYRKCLIDGHLGYNNAFQQPSLYKCVFEYMCISVGFLELEPKYAHIKFWSCQIALQERLTIHTLSTIYKSVTTTHWPTLNSIINLFTFCHSGGGIKWYFKICMSLKTSKAESSLQSLLLIIHKLSTGLVYILCPLLCCMLSLTIYRLLCTYWILKLCCTYHIVFPSYAHQLVCTPLCRTGSSPCHPALQPLTGAPSGRVCGFSEPQL